MATVRYSALAREDLERLTYFLHNSHPEEAGSTVELIAKAVQVLQEHPLIGRPADGGLHELHISRGRSGYVALYEFRTSVDLVIVHRIRHQREAGFEE